MKKAKTSFSLLLILTSSLIIPLMSCSNNSSSISSSIITSTSQKVCEHQDLSFTLLDPTIEKDGKVTITCKDCNFSQDLKLPKLDSENIYIVEKKTTDCTVELITQYTIDDSNYLHEAVDALTFKNKQTIIDEILKMGPFIVKTSGLKSHTVTSIKELKKPSYDHEGEYELQCEKCPSKATFKLPKLTLKPEQYLYEYHGNTATVSVTSSCLKEALLTIKDFNYGDFNTLLNLAIDTIKPFEVTPLINEANIVYQSDGSISISIVTIDNREALIDTSVNYKNDLDKYFSAQYVNTKDCSNPIKKFYQINEEGIKKLNSEINNVNVSTSPLVADAISKINFKADDLTEDEIINNIDEESKHHLLDKDLVVTAPTLDNEGKLSVKCDKFNKCAFSKEYNLGKLSDTKCFTLSYDGLNDVYTPHKEYFNYLVSELRKYFNNSEEELNKMLEVKLKFTMESEIIMNMFAEIKKPEDEFTIRVMTQNKKMLAGSTFDGTDANLDKFNIKYVEKSCHEIKKEYYLSDLGAEIMAKIITIIPEEKSIPLLKNLLIGTVAPTDKEISENKKINHEFFVEEMILPQTYNDAKTGCFKLYCNICNFKIEVNYSFLDVCDIYEEDEPDPFIVYFPDKGAELFADKYPFLSRYELATIRNAFEPYERQIADVYFNAKR